eukprot:scaffold83974_cov46-Attheya_sp.AAC.1
MSTARTDMDFFSLRSIDDDEEEGVPVDADVDDDDAPVGLANLLSKDVGPALLSVLPFGGGLVEEENAAREIMLYNVL